MRTDIDILAEIQQTQNLVTELTQRETALWDVSRQQVDSIKAYAEKLNSAELSKSERYIRFIQLIIGKYAQQSSEAWDMGTKISKYKEKLQALESELAKAI